MCRCVWVGQTVVLRSQHGSVGHVAWLKYLVDVGDLSRPTEFIVVGQCDVRATIQRGQ
jgi:hypothetical protein